MTKLFAILFLVFGLCAATSQSCAYTYNLRELYGYSNSIPTARTYTDLKYCTSLAGGSCCTDTEINNLGSVSDAYVANLTTMASTRDLYLQNIKNNILPNLLTEINSFNTAAATFVSKLESGSDFGFSDDMSDFNFGDDESDDESDDDDDIDWSEFSDDDIDWSEFSDVDDSDFDWSEFSDDSDIDWSEIDEDESDYDDEDDSSDDFGLLDTFAGITNMTTALIDNANAIKANYGTYQTDRRTCILAMADIQNSARCLSCDPNANTNGFVDFVAEYEADLSSELADDRKGVDNAELDDEVDELQDIIEYTGILFYFNFDDTTCNRLQAACKPYLSAAQGQNSLIEAAYAATLITGLTSALTSFNNGNFEAGLEEIMTLFDDDDNDDDDIVPALMEGYLPEYCDLDGDCDWICEGLFMNGVVDPLALIVGGDYTADLEIDDDDDDERRRLAKKRRLGKTSASSTSADEDSNGSWAPAQGASGVTVNFAVDPANTNPSSSKKFGSLNLGNMFVGMMVVISSILLF